MLKDNIYKFESDPNTLLLNKVSSALEYSYLRCTLIQDRSKFDDHDLERFESLVARFSRLSDLLTRDILHLIDSLDLDEPGSEWDSINRAEKIGIIANAEQFILIRKLRHTIAHEFDPAVIEHVFSQVLGYCPMLFDVANRLKQYSENHRDNSSRDPLHDLINSPLPLSVI